MLTKKDMLPLIKKNNLLTCEVDERHLEIINDVLFVGFSCGIEHAKRCVEWRINGEMWSNFIDEDVTSADFEEAEKNATC